MPSIASRNAVVVTIFSPGPSVLMHILVSSSEFQFSSVLLSLVSQAEVGYGEHLVKLCVTSSLVNTVLCLIIQTTLLDDKGGAPKEVGQGDAVDLLIQHAKSQPLSQPLSGQVRAEAPSSLSWARSNGSKSSLPLTNCFKGKARPVLGARSTTNLESPGQYIHSESLPRLPGGKVKKASQPASWLSPL
eukprot:g12785.t1